MEVGKIKIENFKSIQNLEFMPKKGMNVLFGRNGTGKTAVIAALRYLFSGQIENGSIKFGEYCMQVTADVGFPGKNKNTITRGIKKTKTGYQSYALANGKSAKTMKVFESYLANPAVLGTPSSHIPFVTSEQVIKGLDPKGSYNLISYYMGDNSISFQDIMDSEAFNKDETEVLKNFFPETEKFSPQKITEVYNILYEERKKARTCLDQANAKITTVSPVDFTEGQVMKELEELQKKAGAMENAVKILQQAMQTYEKSKKQYDQEMTYCKQMEEYLQTLPQTDLSLTEIEKALSEIEKKNIESLKKLSQAEAVIKEKRALIESKENMLNKLNEHRCPLNEFIQCRTDFLPLIKQLNEEIWADKKALDAAHEQVITSKEAIGIFARKKTSFEVMKKAILEKERVTGLIQARKAAFPAEPVKPDDKVLKENLNYAELKKELVTRLNEVRVYEASKKAVEASKKAKDTLNLYNSLLTGLNPKNGKAVVYIFHKALLALEESCNKKAASLRSDFRVKIVHNKDGVMFLAQSHENSGFQPFSVLSEGEQEYLAFLVMDTFNQLTGARILFLDGLEKLDKESFENLLKLLSLPEVSKDYDHIFFTAALHDGLAQLFKTYNVNIIEMS